MHQHGTEVMAKTAKKAESATKEKKLPQKKVKKRRQVKKGPHGHTLVVLVNDLEHVGKQGDVVEVRPGYARNYLLPYGHAVIPTEANLRTLEQYNGKELKAQQESDEALIRIIDQYTDLKVASRQVRRTHRRPDGDRRRCAATTARLRATRVRLQGRRAR